MKKKSKVLIIFKIFIYTLKTWIQTFLVSRYYKPGKYYKGLIGGKCTFISIDKRICNYHCFMCNWIKRKTYVYENGKWQYYGFCCYVIPGFSIKDNLKQECKGDKVC